MRLAALTAALLWLAHAAPAGEAGGRDMLPEAAQARWDGVGRFNVGDGFCTGALIEPDLVLTAAHCVYTRTGEERRPDRVHFVAGYRQGRFRGHAVAKAIYVHPAYRPGARRIGADIALLRLAEPLDAPVYALARGPSAGDRVSVVSYARDRPEIASIQPGCPVDGRAGAVAILACDVNYGASGAPVFDESGPAPRIVAAIAAKTGGEAEPRAYASVMETALPSLLRVAAEGLEAEFSAP